MLLNKQLDNEEIKRVLELISSSMPSRAPRASFICIVKVKGEQKHWYLAAPPILENIPVSVPSFSRRLILLYFSCPCEPWLFSCTRFLVSGTGVDYWPGAYLGSMLAIMMDLASVLMIKGKASCEQ